MSLGTVGLPNILPLKSVGRSTGVLADTNGVQMRGINTTSVFTEVIEGQPLWDRTNTETHAGHHTNVLIEEAPGYLTALGEDWEQTFDAWLARRRLKEDDNG